MSPQAGRLFDRGIVSGIVGGVCVGLAAVWPWLALPGCVASATATVLLVRSALQQSHDHL